MAKKGSKFTTIEDQYILDHCETMTCREIAEHLGRPMHSVNIRGKKYLGIKQFKPAVVCFTPEEDAWIVENFPKYMYRDLVVMFEQRFGRPVTKQSLKSRNEYKLHVRSGREGWANGDKPYNSVPIGYECIKEGYVYVKVSDTGNQIEDFRPKSQVEYIKYHGSIPEGYVVTFLDGDNTNFSKDNLVAVDIRVRCSANVHTNSVVNGKRNKDLYATALKTWELYYKVKDAKDV